LVEREDGEETMAKEKKETTAVDMKEQLAKLRQKEAKLLADLAVKEHPELEASIQSVSAFQRDVQKADSALKMGGEVAVEKEREAIEKQIAFYTNKLEALQESLKMADKDRVLAQLTDARKDAMIGLKKAIAAAAVEFETVGVEVEDLIPTVVPFMEEINALEIPAEAPAAEAPAAE